MKGSYGCIPMLELGLGLVYGGISVTAHHRLPPCQNHIKLSFQSFPPEMTMCA